MGVRFRHPMRLKIVFAKTRVLFFVGNVDLQVNQLCKQVGEMLSNLVGGDVHIKHFQTGDGFLVPNFQIISDILREDDLLHAIDMGTFMEQEYKLCSHATHTFSRSDWNDDKLRSFLIGYHQHNQIYISFINARKLTHLELLKKSDLQSFTRKETQLVTLYECSLNVGEDSNQVCNAKLQVETMREGDTCCKLLLSIQTSSDPQPEIKELTLHVAEKLKIGDLKTIQPAIINWIAKEKPMELPSPTTTGKMLPDIIEAVTITGVAPASSTCDKLKITQQPINGSLNLRVNQSYGSGDKITILYEAEFLVVNSSDKPCNFPKVSSSYIANDGKRIPFDKTFIGPPGASNCWQDYIDFPPNSTFTIAMGAQLTLPGSCTSRRGRTPPGLPQPMNIQFVLSPASGEEHILEVQQTNGELKLDSREKEDIFWMACDDARTETRYVFKIRKEETSDKTEYLRIYYKDSSSKYYYMSDFQKLAWQASIENTTSLLVDDLSSDRDKYHRCVTNVFALVHPEKRYVYALQIEMETDNCKQVNCFPIPPLSS